MAGKRIGVLALQGAFLEHEACLKKCGVEAIQVRKKEELDGIDGLIIPGGESTTIGRLMREYGIDAKIIEKAEAGMPIWGTCAGMILLAKELDQDNPWLRLMDMKVKRNAYGRQVDSFETELDIKDLGKIKGVFIRAPYVERVWGEAEVLCVHDEKIVMVRQGKLLATSFHPELTDDLKLHKYFVELC